jgi:hypothetical protein
MDQILRYNHNPTKMIDFANVGDSDLRSKKKGEDLSILSND